MKAALRRNKPDNPVHIGIFDVDFFKDINDTFGHDEGDHYLRYLAQGIQTALPQNDVIARLGGDEFALLLHDCGSHEALQERIKLIYDALKPYEMSNSRKIDTSISLGISRSASSQDHTYDLLKSADIALYEAKSRGRNRAVLFDGELRKKIESISTIRTSFEDGIENGQLFPHYQPIAPLQIGRKFKFEALLRWQHPTKGLLGPSYFASALSDPRITNKVDHYVLTHAIRELPEFKAFDVGDICLAVNATAADLRDPAYIRTISAAIESGEIAPSELCVEISEHTVLSDRDMIAMKNLQRLFDMGVDIAFDDFGVGFASLSHLRDLPVTLVKIDKSFVDRIDKDASCHSLVKGIVTICLDLGKIVVAEGVERQSQLDIIRELGCDYAQGYLIAKPCSIAECTNTVRKWMRGDI